MKSTKNIKLTVLTANVIAILVLCALLLGSTFAWFNDSVTSANNVISSGNLNIEFEYWNGEEWIDVNDKTDVLTNDLWEPGVTEVAYLKVKNAGSLALKYQLGINIVSETVGVNVAGEEFKLSDYIMFGVVEDVNGESDAFATREDAIAAVANAQKISAGYAKEGYMVSGEEIYLAMTVYMPTTVGNEANHNGTNVPAINLGLSVNAAQVSSEDDAFDNGYDQNAEYPARADVWDGTADTSWYNDTDTVFDISTAEELAGFALLVGTDNFAGKTVNLKADIDLGMTSATGEPISFAPIGTTGERDSRNRLVTSPFSGTFDGQDHVIENMYQSGWAFGYEWGQYGSLGLFSQLENATVKNLTVKGVEVEIEGGDVGGICGSAEGECVFENITIEDSEFGTYNNGIGGIIGWSGAGEYNFKNVKIAEDVVLGGLWGSFDSSVGGVVGQAEAGAAYNFENVEISCRLDVYNDVTASYQYYIYRMSGMIIGRCAETITIDERNYPDLSKYTITCTNVTVNYGDWMNYHYCYGFNGSRYTRVEAGYAYGGLDINAADHAESCTDHLLCLPFDGLFGGDQYGVNPIREYAGVTVNYPATYTPESN